MDLYQFFQSPILYVLLLLFLSITSIRFWPKAYEIYVQEPKGWRVIDSFLNNRDWSSLHQGFRKRIAQYEKKFPCDAPRSFICVQRDLVTLTHSHSAYLPKTKGTSIRYAFDTLMLGRTWKEYADGIWAQDDQHALQQFFSSNSFWDDDLVEWRLYKINKKNKPDSIIASGKGPRYLKTGNFIAGGGTNCSELQGSNEKVPE